MCSEQGGQGGLSGPLGHDRGGCTQGLRDRAGRSGRAVGAAELGGFGRGLDSTLGTLAILSGRSSAWLLPGVNRGQLGESSGGDHSSPGQGCWAGAARQAAGRVCALENRPGVGERQAGPMLLCVGVGSPF